MKVFITGATGYIGGSVSARLVDEGHEVLGLVRSEEGASKLKERGVVPHLGSLGDAGRLAEGASWADAVVNAADSDHAFAVRSLLDALEGTGKKLIHTSGSSVVADRAVGELSDRVYNEDTPYEPVPEKASRVAIDRMVRAGAWRGIASIVLCPCMIYGEGRGLHRESIQVPWMIDLAAAAKVGRHVGRGENVWSHVHIDDLVDAYLLALGRAPAGSFFFLENGESSYREIARAASRMLGFGDRAEEWPIAEAVLRWGPETAHFTFGSNSRVRSAKARGMLGWAPTGPSLMDEIELGHYRDVYRP